MKVYKLHKNYKYEFPGDMVTILAFLKRHGDILVEPIVIQDFWYDFSTLYNTYWLTPDNDLLKSFSHWLNDKDI